MWWRFWNWRIWKGGDEPSFYDLFEEQARLIQEAAQLLLQIFENGTGTEEAARLQQKIKDLEHCADGITHTVISRTHAQLITPIRHEDIRALVSRLDDVIDTIDHVARAFVKIYGMMNATDHARDLARIVCEATDALVVLCPLLRKPRQNVARIRDLCALIHSCENRADEVQDTALRELFVAFSAESVSTPYYLAWRDILRRLEKTTDRAEDCANVADCILQQGT